VRKNFDRKYQTMTEILLFIVGVTDVTKSDETFPEQFCFTKPSEVS